MTKALPLTFMPLGPAPAPFAQLRGRSRRHILVKTPLEDAGFEDAIAWLSDRSTKEAKTTIKIDVDPMSLL